MSTIAHVAAPIPDAYREAGGGSGRGRPQPTAMVITAATSTTTVAHHKGRRRADHGEQQCAHGQCAGEPGDGYRHPPRSAARDGQPGPDTGQDRDTTVMAPRA